MSSIDLVANHYTVRPQTASGPREPSGPVSGGPTVQGEFEPLETNNWLLHLKYVRGEHDTCKQLADFELVKSRGHNEYANYIMGLILRVEGHIQESLEFFNKCCQLNPRSVDNIKQVARSLFLLGRPQQAVEKYGEALKLKTPDWNIFHSLGLCYMQMGRYEEAEHSLVRAVELGRTEDSHTALARLYAKMSDPARAVATYKTVFSLFPSNPETAVDLGQLYFEMGEFQRAFDAWGTALGHDPPNARALLALGAEFQRHDEPDVALAKYKLCAQGLPESAFLWNNIGMCFFSKRKFVAAISCLKRAVYLAPLDWKALFNLGLVHMHTKQFVSAFHFSSASVKRNPLHAPTFQLLAIALYTLSDVTGARRALEQALKLSPDNPEIRANFALFLKQVGEEAAAQAQIELFYRSSSAYRPRLDPQLQELVRVTFDDTTPLGQHDEEVGVAITEDSREVEEDEV